MTAVSRLALRLCSGCLALACAAGTARADPASESYESRRLQLFLSAAGLELDAAPEGKRIAYVRFERREVFEPDDLAVPLILPRFASTWPNAFHWLTTEGRIRQELLLREGEPYSQRLADESMRNLRDLFILALVNVVAVRTDDPRAVGVIVYTRDIWSLRFEQGFEGAGTTFAANGRLVERNFLGRGQVLVVRGSIDPLRFSVGQSFADPRLFGSALSLVESLDVIWKRATTEVEGSTGTLSFGRPFYNLAQRHAFRIYGSYANYVSRDTRAGEVVGYDVNPMRRGLECEPGAAECLARVWREHFLQLELTGDYRVGTLSKHTFTLGAEVIDRRSEAIAETALTPEQEPLFRSLVLPRVRRDVYPFVRYRLELPDFAVLTNLGTYGLSESVQLGPRLDGLIGVPLRAYGASSDGLVLHGLFSYVWSQDGALLDFALEGRSRLESGNVVDVRAIARARGATAHIPALLGRLVLRALWDVRKHDTQQTFVSLGGQNGLRGYPAQRFYGYGAHKILANLEYRSQPWLLQSVHLGVVAFYDVGSVYRELRTARFHHDVGAGLRVLFPQLNRTVFRLDFGVPLDSKGVSVQMTYGSEPIVTLTASEDLQALADDAAGLRRGL